MPHRPLYNSSRLGSATAPNLPYNLMPLLGIVDTPQRVRRSIPLAFRNSRFSGPRSGGNGPKRAALVVVHGPEMLSAAFHTLYIMSATSLLLWICLSCTTHAVSQQQPGTCPPGHLIGKSQSPVSIIQAACCNLSQDAEGSIDIARILLSEGPDGRSHCLMVTFPKVT